VTKNTGPKADRIKVLARALELQLNDGGLPPRETFQNQFRRDGQWQAVDELFAHNYISHRSGSSIPTLNSRGTWTLARMGRKQGTQARRILGHVKTLLGKGRPNGPLARLHRENPEAQRTIEEIAAAAKLSPENAGLAIDFLTDLGLFTVIHGPQNRLIRIDREVQVCRTVDKIAERFGWAADWNKIDPPVDVGAGESEEPLIPAWAITNLTVLLEQLRPIESYPWTEVQEWAARAKPLIRDVFRQHLADFEAAVSTPQWYRRRRVLSAGVDREGEEVPHNHRAEAAEKKENLERAAQAKGRLAALIEGILATVSEREAPAVLTTLQPPDDLPPFERNCWLFLQRAFDLSNNGDPSQIFNFKAVGEDLGLDEGTSFGILRYLDENGKLRLIGRTDTVFTPNGASEARRDRREAQRSERPKEPTMDPKKVFVVHGRDEAARDQVARFVTKLGLEPIILSEQPDGGQTVIEKFEAYAGTVGFAIVLLTPDDVGGLGGGSDPQRPRARQNVILELGWFYGRIGRANVCALHKGNVELPSDFVGVVYTAMDSGGGWQTKLAREMKAAGLDVDMNKLLA
jgi:predicted nucleotide-binding protein